MSEDAGQDYFAEGLTKDISIALTKIPGLFLAADETPQAQVAQTMNPRELAVITSYSIHYTKLYESEYPATAKTHSESVQGGDSQRDPACPHHQGQDALRTNNQFRTGAIV